MTSLTIQNVPKTFITKVGNTIDFSNILGLHWDGMDWCQYNEVIPDKEDILMSKNYKKNVGEISGEKFLSHLISR